MGMARTASGRPVGRWHRREARLGAGCPADHGGTLEDHDIQPGSGQHGRRNESVVARADDDHIGAGRQGGSAHANGAYVFGIPVAESGQRA